jgi:hypothetical protein
VDPNYEVSKEVRLHATKVCDQIEQLKEQLPWKYSFKYFCDKYPELKVALDEYLANNSLVPLIDEDAIEGSEVVWPAQALGIWNLDAIYSEHFYEAYADSFKLQLQVYIEEVYLKRLEKVSTQEVRKIEALGQRCQKELNAMRTSLHLAMSYSKLQAAQEGKDQAAQKKRNEMADSLLKSEG